MAVKEIKKSCCRMCGMLCGIDVHLEDGKVVAIEGNKEYLANRGRICIKGSSGLTQLYHEDRLKKPLKKTENGFVEIELEQAMDEIAAKMKELQEKYGTQSVGVWKGEGTGFAQQEELARRFAHAIKTPNYFSNDTQCYAGRYISYNLTYGTWPAADFRNTKLAVIWGTNAPASHSYWTQDINYARENGAKLIVIDTMYTEMARVSDLYIQIKPGTDTVLAWGIINRLISEDIIDMDFIEKYTHGFEELKEYSKEFTEEYVYEYTGVTKEQLDEIISYYKTATPNVSSWCGTGLEHQMNGVNNVRSVNYIDALIGAIDVPGGMVTLDGFGPSHLEIELEEELVEKAIGRKEYPVLYGMRGECHTLLLMDQILSEKPYPFKGLVMTAANPVLTNANSTKVVEALKALDLLVVKDLYMTETAELADYVIPAASYLERSELQYNGINQIVKLTEKVVDFGLQNEYDFFKGLADRLGASDTIPWENEEALNRWLVEPTGMSLEELAEHRDGYQFKPLTYGKIQKKFEDGEKVFATKTGKIEFTSEYLRDMGYDALAKYNSAPSYIENPEEEFPMILMTGARKVMYFHGRYRNIPQINKVMPEGIVEIHPKDAANLGILDGEKIKVETAHGSIEIKAKVVHEKEIYPGSIQITHGFKKSNANVLIGDGDRDPISGFPALKSAKARIVKL
ncbi:MAG: molybdopterin-dependent oxidoreductase [Firmicutes bacterium]|jgi:anaerobic selenocysteine-containing dehydrogenase|nr:molybdopterin-dependent oxidoreductase [Bacillota bacterium]